MAVEKYVDSRGRVSYRIRGAKLIYPNFAGNGGQFNDEGNRNFNIELTQDEFDFLTDEGFRPRMREKIDADPQLLLKINVKFKDDPADTRNPKILFKTQYGNKRMWSEHKKAVVQGEEIDFSPVDILDWADIENVNLSFSAYRGKMSDHNTAYLQMLIATKHEDPFENEFYDNDEPDTALNTMTFQKVDADLKSIE